MMVAEQETAVGGTEVRGEAAGVGEALEDRVPAPQGPVRAPVAAIRSRTGVGSPATS
jgi:hypothetical protein